MRLLWITAEIKKLDAKRQAYLRRGGAIKPPTKEQVEKAQALSNETDQLIAQSKTSSELFALAKQGVELFNSVQSEPDATA